MTQFQALSKFITPESVFWQIAIVNVICLPFIMKLCLSKRWDVERAQNSFNYKFIIFLCWIFCIFPTFDGDFKYYCMVFDRMLKCTTYDGNMEQTYVWIAKNLSFGSYFIFRAVIWGGALLAYSLSFHRLKMQSSLIWIGFVMTTLVNIAYLRVSLGMGILLLGYSFIIYPIKNNNNKSYILGTCLMLLSTIFHKSMFVILSAAIFSLFPVTRFTLASAVVLFPVIIYIFKVFFPVMYGNDDPGAVYLAADASSFGIGYSIFNYLGYVYVFGTLYALFRDFFRKRLPFYMKKLFLFGTIIATLYLITYIVFERGGIGGLYLSNRIYLMVYTVFPILYYYQIKKQRQNNINKGAAA